MIPQAPELIFAAGMVFARIGAILMLLPGFGEPSIPVRIRLAFALLTCLILGPLVAPNLPAMPAQPLAMAGLVMGEVIIGLMIGAVARIFMAAAAICACVAYASIVAYVRADTPTHVPGLRKANFTAYLGWGYWMFLTCGCAHLVSFVFSLVEWDRASKARARRRRRRREALGNDLSRDA